MSSNFKDTISSGSSYYNNQFRNDPGFEKGYAKIRNSSYVKVDSLETEQQRLERDVQIKFQANQQVPGGKVVLIAQIGRGAILALVLPPYYLFYEGPKWIVIQLEPLVWMAIEKSGAFLLMIFTFSLDCFVGLGKKLQLFKKPKNYIKQKLQVLNGALARIGEQLAKKLAQVLKPIGKLIETLKQYKQSYDKKRADVVVWLKTLPFKLQKFIETKKPVWKSTLKQKCVKAANLILDQANKVIAPVLVFMEKSVSQIVAPMAYIAKKLVQTIQKAAIPVQAFIQEQIAHPLKKAYKSLIKPLEAINEKVKDLTVKAAIEVSQKIVTLAKLAQSVTLSAVLPLQRTFNQAAHATAAGTVSLIKKMQEVLGQTKKLQSIFERAFKVLFDQGKKQGKNAFGKFKKIATIAQKKAAAAIAWMHDKILKIPSALVFLWKKIQMYFSSIVKKTILVIRLGIAWTKVIFRYSLNNLWN